MSEMQKVLFYVFVFFLASCTMPETRIYSLHVPVEGETADSKTGASIVINIDSREYLKQPYIARRNSVYQLVISKYSRWESSPRKMVRKEFKKALSSSGFFKDVRVSSTVPKGFYALKINLDGFERFDGENGSLGVLLFDVALFPPGVAELYGSTVSKKVKLDGQDYTSLASGLSRALQQGIEEVRTNIIRAIQSDR